MRRTLAVSFALLIALVSPASANTADLKVVETDLLIVGGTESGVAAAIQAARQGVRSIVLVNDIDWLGGQFTAEALGAIDENRGRSGTNDVPFPRSGLFKELLDLIEAQNTAMYGQPRPGNTVVKTTCRAADTEKLFRRMVEPYVQSGRLRIISGFYPTGAEHADSGKRLTGLRFGPVAGNAEGFTVRAKLTIDASDWGEAIQVSGAEYEFGPDLQSKYREPSAPTDRGKYPLTDMNPITWCVVIEEASEEKPIAKPERFDERCYLLSTRLTADDYRQVGWTHKRLFSPDWPPPEVIYRGRRLVDRHSGGVKADRDVILLNFPPQNYPLDRLPQRVIDALEKNEAGSSQKNIVQMTRAQRQIIFDDAKQHALGFLYHLQTTVHDRMKPDERQQSFRRFRLTDEFGTSDRLPLKPYVRESLRLLALHMMVEQETLKDDRKQDRFATVMYPDGVGCWQFEYDFHPTGRGFLPKEGPSGPWECYGKPGRGWGPYSDRALLPLRSLIPRRLDGLLAAQKNLGFSSIVSAAVRLHDQSMMVGQASGATAAVCLKENVQPRQIPESPALLAAVRQGLCNRLDQGQPLTLWPFRDLEPSHPAFEAVNLLAVRRALPWARTDIDFQPEQPATPEWRAAVVKQSLATKEVKAPPPQPDGELTRGEFARRWWDAIQQLPEKR
ncbi:MAG: FAD-dependent oxidoreductase [Planctomycetia bacterium]|nr:FAD-dependent oxidoreductase [Planctomycetia bacterium]